MSSSVLPIIQHLFQLLRTETLTSPQLKEVEGQRKN